MVSDKWKKLTIKEEVVQLSDELSITVKGLAFKEMGEMSKFHDRKDYAGAMTYILETTLKKSPEVTGEDITEIIDNISSDIAMKIIQKVQELSGLSGDVPKEESAN